MNTTIGEILDYAWPALRYAAFVAYWGTLGANVVLLIFLTRWTKDINAQLRVVNNLYDVLHHLCVRSYLMRQWPLRHIIEVMISQDDDDDEVKRDV